MTHNQIKMKSCVMLCYGMSQEKPGKFQGGTDIFIWFLKDSTSFLLEKVEKRTQAKKNQQQITDSGNRSSLGLKFKVVQGKSRKGHKNDYLRPNKE